MASLRTATSRHKFSFYDTLHHIVKEYDRKVKELTLLNAELWTTLSQVNSEDANGRSFGSLSGRSGSGSSGFRRRGTSSFEVLSLPALQPHHPDLRLAAPVASVKEVEEEEEEKLATEVDIDRGMTIVDVDVQGALENSNGTSMSPTSHLPGALQAHSLSHSQIFLIDELGVSTRSHSQGQGNPVRFFSRDELKDTFDVKSEWLEAALPGSSSHRPVLFTRSYLPNAPLCSKDFEEDVEYTSIKQDDNSCFQRFVDMPSKRRRILWELFGVLLIVYDMITLPLMVFEIPDNIFRDCMNWTTLIFWTINVAASCTVGYVDDGALILIPRSIVCRYLKGWFIIDFFVVLPDWFFTMSKTMSDDSDGGAGESFKMLRVLRLLRLARLLRLLKLRKAWQMIYDLVDSEKLGILLNVIKMILVLLLVNHFVACAWFYVGEQAGDQGNSWLKEHGFTDDEVEWEFQYLTAYHWSITQFTPSSMHVQPQSESERLFAIVVVVFALVGFSYLVGSITGSLAQLRTMAEQETKEFWTLRRFLKKNQICPRVGGYGAELYIRIISYLEARWAHQQDNIPMDNVKILGLLSEQLDSELQTAIQGPHLRIHPLFNKLQDVSPVTIRRLATSAVSRLCLARNDLFFIAGEVATHMSIVVRGKLSYSKHPDPPEVVEHGEDWIAEPVLWLESWSHLGDLQANYSTELLLVNPKMFFEAVKRNPVSLELCGKYAKKFCAWLIRNKEEFNLLSDISQGEDVTDELNKLIVECSWGAA